MLSDRDFLEDLWRDVAGLSPSIYNLDYQYLKETQFNDMFIQYMKNRMVMGAFRYGDFTINDYNNWPYVKSLLTRIKTFLDTQNIEYLIDIANIAMIAFTAESQNGKCIQQTSDQTQRVANPQTVNR